MPSNQVRKIRIFISSPGDVLEERTRAKQVIEGMQRRYAGQLELEAVLWEKMPLQPDMSFQDGIETILSGQASIDIAVFILWSRFGSPLGPNILRRDGRPYESGTEREFDLMSEARIASGGTRPDILAYIRRDNDSFHERLRDESTAKLREFVDQKVKVESFIETTFKDKDSKLNKGAYHTYTHPVEFTHALREHLKALLDAIAADIPRKTIWDASSQGSPFRGLEAFQPEHAPVFFGREEEIQEACLALRESAKEGPAFLMLLGASGSGKSSLARAGVLPAIRDYELNSQVAQWRTLIVTPSELGADPVAGLVRRLLEEGTGEPSGKGLPMKGKVLPELRGVNKILTAELIAESLSETPVRTCQQVFGPAFEVAKAKEGGPVRLLLLIDQLEELFTTPGITAVNQSKFLAVVKALAETRKIWVVATARSDFYQRMQEERAIMDLKAGRGQLDVLPPSADALRRLVEQPAELSGLRFEKWDVGDDPRSLADDILKDASTHAELLPLVEFVMGKLFEMRTSDGVMTRSAFKQLGGSVEGALARIADQVFERLPEDARRSLADVMHALVSIAREKDGDSTAEDAEISVSGTEKVVRLRAKLEDFAKGTPQRAFVDAFVDARLFIADKHPETGVATLMVAHESLLRVWPKASEWVDDNRDILRVRSRIDSRMKEGGLLPEGDRLLSVAKSHIEINPSRFSESQKRFVAQSLAAAKSARTRRLIALAGLVCAAVVAVIATVVYYSKQREEDALASQFIAQAERSLSMKDYARAEMAAAESLMHRDSGAGRELLLKARSGGVSLNRRGLTTAGKIGESAFSRDGAIVVALREAGPKDRVLLVESTASGKTIGTIDASGFTGAPECVTVLHDHQDATTVAVARPDHSVVVWKFSGDKAAGPPIELTVPKADGLGRHKKRVPSMAFHPSKPWLITCGEDQKLCLWDISSSPPKLMWEQVQDKQQDTETHATAIHGVSFNADGTVLGSGGGDYLVKLWKTEEMAAGYDGTPASAVHKVKPFNTLTGHSDSVFVVAFSPDGSKLASGGYDRVIRVWDLNLKNKEGNPPTVGTLSGHEGTVLDLAFSDDSKVLISGGKDMAVRLWDAEEARILTTLHPECGVIRSVACRGFGGKIHCGGEAGWSVWTAGSSKVASKLWTGSLVGAIAFDPKGRFVATGGSGVVHLWDSSNQPLKDLSTSNDQTVNGVAVSADGKWLAAAGEDMMVHVWDIESDWKPVVPADATALKHKGAIWGLCFDPAGKWLASGNTDEDKRLRLWSIGEWKLLKESAPQDHSVYTLASTTDGSRLVSGDSDGKVLLWDCTKPGLEIIQTEANVGDGEGEKNVWSVAICPEPLSVLSGNSNGRVYRWVPGKDSAWKSDKPGEKISISDADAEVNHTINSVAYDEREGWVAAVGDGGSLELYDTDLKHLRSLPGHDGTVWYVAVNPQGNRLASGGGDKFLRLWNVDELKQILQQSTPQKLAEETRLTTGMVVNKNVIELAKPAR